MAEIPDSRHARAEHPAVCGGSLQDSEEGVQRGEGHLQGVQVLVHAWDIGVCTCVCADSSMDSEITVPWHSSAKRTESCVAIMHQCIMKM